MKTLRLAASAETYVILFPSTWAMRTKFLLIPRESGVDTGRGEIFYGEGLAYLTLYWKLSKEVLTDLPLSLIL